MEHYGLLIDEYKEGDLDEILNIENDSFTTPWSPGLFRSEMTNPISRVLVGRSEGGGGKIAGYVVFWRVADELQVQNIAVRRDLRKCGIASRLLTGVIKDFRSEGAHWIILEVRRNNIAAQKLYKRFGFSIRGVRRNYYTDTGEDALIMSADLEQIQTKALPLEKCGAIINDSIK